MPTSCHRISPGLIALACLGLAASSACVRGTVLTFDPAPAFLQARPGQWPDAYGQRVAAANQDGFNYGSEGGWTPDIRLSAETLRLLLDQPGNHRTHGLQVLPAGWNHGPDESALRALQSDTHEEQQIRLWLRGTDPVHPVLLGFDVVGLGGTTTTVPSIIVSDGVLTTLFATNNAIIPSSGVLRLRFDPPLSSPRIGVVLAYGRAALPVGLDNISFAQRSVLPEIWQVEAGFPANGTGACANQSQHPVGLQIDSQLRPVVAWVEYNGCSSDASLSWSRPDRGIWPEKPLMPALPNASLNPLNSAGGASLVLSTNDAPFLFYSAANFASDSPYFLRRLDLETTPNGPGVFVHGFAGGRGPDITFDADGRATALPEFVSHTMRSRILLNGVTALTAEPVFQIDGDLIFRRGPAGQTHVLYSAEGQLRYNGGSPASDVAILPVNVGNARPHDLAIGHDNSVHASAALGNGRFFFGATGSLAYLHSADGVQWTTNVVMPQTDVGATAIAVDSQGRPAIAFTRGFNNLYFTRQTEAGWTPPVLVRTGLGGWGRSRAIRLTLSPNDQPYIAVPDALTDRLLLLSSTTQPAPADLSVHLTTATNRAAIGSATEIVLTVTNAAPREAAFTRLHLQLPAEIVVRDLQPRPSIAEGSSYTWELGTVQAYERRALRLTVSALDPVKLCATASVTSDLAESNPTDNTFSACLTDFSTADCLSATPPADCAELRLHPKELPPALAGQPWSTFLRGPQLPAEAVLRPLGPLPSGFCLTADGQLRGFAPKSGELEFHLESIWPDGSSLPWTRRLRIETGQLPETLLAFWPLDGDTMDVVAADAGATDPRVVFVPGMTGLAAQSARNVLEDRNATLRRPAPMLLSPPLRQGETIGLNGLTLTGWFRRDGGSGLGTDRRAYGSVLSLIDAGTWGRERHVYFALDTGRIQVGDGPPDFRANILAGPVLPTNVWQHLALVCEPNQTRLFINGRLAIEGRFPQPLAERPRVSAGGFGHDVPFSGSVDEVALFAGAWTADQVDGLMRQPLPRPTPLPLAGEFPLAAISKELVLPSATVGLAYDVGLSAAYCGAPTAFIVTEGAWPRGLALERDGRVTGVPDEDGNFQVVVRARDVQGNRAELVVRLTVQDTPPVFTKQPAGQRVKLGGDLVLVAATHRPASLQWYLNGQPIPGATASVLSVAHFSHAQIGDYSVRAENTGGVAWSDSARVSQAQQLVPPGVELRNVQIRPDQLVRLKIATIPGRIYELQRASDLPTAVKGGWLPLQRLVASGENAELFDRIAGRPQAAFYRIVEKAPPPPAPFALEDSTRFVGLSADGQPRPGLLPSADPATGGLGPFEYHPAGAAMPSGHGLCLRFPQGAQTLVRDGATILQFRTVELFFADDSPIQWNEGNGNRLVVTSPTPLELAVGPIHVATLETLLGRAPGSGIEVRIFRQFDFKLRRGLFDGASLREARLAWSKPQALPFPMPTETGDFPQFDLDLTGRAFHLPIYGEFTLPDRSDSPATLIIPAARPASLTIRPGSQLSFAGIADVRFRGGPSFTVDFLANAPEFRLALRARQLRLPGNLSLSTLLAPPPQRPASIALARPGLTLATATSAQEYYLNLEKEIAQHARAMAAAGFGTTNTYVPPNPNDVDPTVVNDEASRATRRTFRAKDYAETDPIGSQLGTLPLWRGYVETRGRLQNLSTEQQSIVRRVVQKQVAQAAESADSSPNPEAVHTLELRARLLEHIAAIALASNDADSIVLAALRNAYDLFRRLGDQTNCQLWEPKSLERMVRSIQSLENFVAQRPSLLPATAPRDLRDWIQTLLVCRGQHLASELGVRGGEATPALNPTMQALHRYEAALRLEQALALAQAGQRVGLAVVVVPSEVFSQLILRIWEDLRGRVVRATEGCDFGTWFYLLPELGEILESYAELLRSTESSDESVAAMVRQIVDFMNLETSFRNCLQFENAAEQVRLQEEIASATDTSQSPRFLLPALRTLRTLLLDIPDTVGVPRSAIERNLAAIRVRIDRIFQGNLDLWVRANALTVEDLRQLLEAALLHDQLVIRFHPDTEQLLLTREHLERLRQMIHQTANDETSPIDLERIARAMIEAMRLQDFVERPRPQRPAMVASPTVVAWREAVLAGLEDTTTRLRQRVVAQLDEHHQASLADLLAAVDIQLPGGLTVEDAWGEIRFHTERRELFGRVGGSLRIPGAGLTLNLRSASIHSGGALSAALTGSLALPPVNPVATLTIPSHQPARLTVRPGEFSLSGGAQLRLAHGGEIGCYLSLHDPIYQFSATARGLKFRLARDLAQSIGWPNPERLPTEALRSALDLLTRTGLILDGAVETADDPAAPLSDNFEHDERPRPADSDDLIAATRALELFLKHPGALAPPPATGPAPQTPRPSPATLETTTSNLVQQIATRIERESQQLRRNADELSQLDLALLGASVNVSAAELAVLRGPQLTLVAQRLGSFGNDFLNAQSVLTHEELSQRVGATQVDLATATRAYFQNFADCLGALRTNLLALTEQPQPAWSKGPHWNPDAARETQQACLRFVQTLQLTGGDTATAAVQLAQQLFCDLARAILDDQLESTGLNRATGGAPAPGEARLRYEGLGAETALASVRPLLDLEALEQQAGWCDPDGRRSAAVAALSLRARNARVAELHQRATRSGAFPWEGPEGILALATNLLEIVTLPGQLGLTAYPESAPRLRGGALPAETLNPATDVADLVQIIGEAAAELTRLHQDVTSGYRAELDRRALALHRLPLPQPALVRNVHRLFADAPGWNETRQSMASLASHEASALLTASARPDFFSRWQAQAQTLVRRALGLAALMEVAPVAAPLDSRRRPTRFATVQQALADSFLTRLTTHLAATAEAPWWQCAGVARALREGAEVDGPPTPFQDGLMRLAVRNAQTLKLRLEQRRAQAAALATRFDLALPGDIDVQRLFGDISFNRNSGFFKVALGGRIEFPNVPTGPGRVAFFELEQLRYESNGRFAFAAATRSPIPFPNASFAGRITAEGDWPHRALTLSGRGELSFTTPPANPETGQPFAQTVAATLGYEPIARQPDGTPVGWRFRVGAEGAFRRSFGPHVGVFAASAGVTVGRTEEGQPLGGVTVGGSVGLIRKAARLNVDSPTLDDFELVIEDAGLEITGEPDSGGSAGLTRGTLRLPSFFYPATIPPELRCPGTLPATGASVAIRDPIRLSYAVGGRPQLTGVIRFSQFGLRLPKAPFLSLVLCQADLGLDEQGRPFLDVARAGMQLDLPWDKGLFRLQNLHLGLDGAIRGQLFLTEDLDLVNASGLRVTLPAATPDAPPGAAPSGCQGTSLILEDIPNSPQPRVVIRGGVTVQLPNALVTDPSGGQVRGTFCGGIRLEPSPDGPIAHAFLDELAFSGDFRFGGNGIALRRARIAAANFEGILQPNSERPFLLSLSGDLEAGPFVFGMNGAQLRYLGPDRPPAFAIETLRYARNAAQPLPPPLSFLPFAVDYAAFRLKDPLAPIERLLHPANVVVTVSGRVGFPTVEKAFLRGAVSGVEFSFRENGEPIPPAIDGFDLHLSSGAELKLPVFGDLGGKIRIGGLRRAFTGGPGHIYAVGEIGGTQQGYRLNLLGAFNLIGPIGLCLDVNFGAAGLTLSPTPFQITGAAGGLAFLTTENPCDFTQYFVFDPTTGTHQLKQSIELPSIPVGLSWADFANKIEELTQRAAAFATNFDPGSIQLPGGPAAAVATPTPTEVTTEEDARALASSSHGAPPTTSLPGVRPRIAQLDGNEADPIGCPTNCPPATVAIVCQPHPDRAQYPNRIIFKFSSISESSLTNAPPAGLGLDPATVARLGSDANAVAQEIADRLIAHLTSILPAPAPALPTEVVRFLERQQIEALANVHTVMRGALAAALRSSPDVYAAIRRLLYEGAPCPDLTIALSGRASIVGLSAFGWIEGRQVSSLSGSGGVVGLLHLLGIPIGEARAFIATTDAQGDPNPSLCGQVTASFGPLDFGQADMALRCDGCVTELLRLFPTVAAAIGTPTLRLLLNRLDPDLTRDANDPAVWLHRLRQRPAAEQIRLALGVLNDVLGLSPGQLPSNLPDQIRSAVASAWDRIQPQLVVCGEIQPRLLGLPLTLGGRTASLSFLCDKTGYIGDFSFAPSALAPFFPPGDEASLSYSLRVPDPYAVLLDAFSGRLNDPAEQRMYLREKIDYALQNQVIAAQYTWHPFGLELGDAAVRVLLPDLTDHPALPGRRWINPDTLSGSALPTRDEVLVQAAASGQLGRAFAWLGSRRDFSSIFPANDPRGQALDARAAELRHDYFPHGGLVGGARMALPRILMADRSEWLPHYEKARGGATLFDQVDGALTLLNEYILRNETNGTAAFYVPAPNPPLLYGRDGRIRSTTEILRMLTDQPDEFSPEGLLRQWRGLDADTATSWAHLYPDDLSFFRAEMTNFTLFGVPVFGTARMTGKPTPLRLLDGQPLAHLEVEIAQDSALGRLAGRGLSIGFDLHATPARALSAWATELRDALQEPAPPNPARAGLAGRTKARETLSRFRAELAQQLPRYAARVLLPSIAVEDPRDWGGPGFPITSLPRPGRGIAPGAGRGLPAAPLLRADLALQLFSPFYEPTATGDGPAASARREGGIAAEGRLEILPDRPGRSGTALLEASVTAAEGLPHLRGRVRQLNLPLPFPGIALSNAEGDFDNQANPFLRATLRTQPIRVGEWFTLTSATGQADWAATATLGTTLGLGQTPLPQAALEMPPIRLQSPRLGGRGIVLHGQDGPTASLRISESAWNARASWSTEPSLQSSPNTIVLRADLGGTTRDVVRVSGLPDAPFSFRGEALSSFVFSLATAPSTALTAELFPGLTVPGLPQKSLALAPDLGPSLEMMVSSDGSFRIRGKLANSLTLGPLGTFAAGADVLIEPTGVSISGRVGDASGSLTVGVFDGRIEARFSARLVLPRLIAFGDRIMLASPEGGDLVTSLGPDGTCVEGAVLTLQHFAPGLPPLRIPFPRFCLGANQTFANVLPASATAGRLSPTTTPLGQVTATLPLGNFALAGLSNLRLSGSFPNQTMTVHFDSTLQRQPLFQIPIRGRFGTDGIQLTSSTPTLQLLGLNFSSMTVSAEDATGQLPTVTFAGRLAALPAPLHTIDFAGAIPGTGDFTLAPASPLASVTLLPRFPLQQVTPSVAYRAVAYPSVIRSQRPIGYWPLEDLDDKVLDERLTSFPPNTGRRNGDRVGALLPSFTGALTDATRVAQGFDGQTTWVRLPSDALAPSPSAFSVSLWLRRAAGRTGTVPALASPQTAASRGEQWALRLQQTAPANGTRVHWFLNGLQAADGSALAPLTSHASFDNDSWRHVVAVYDGVAQYLYIDGRLDSWQACRGSITASSRQDTILGGRRNGTTTTEHFAGILDEVALFASALAPIEIHNQWLAAGARGGVALAGQIPANVIPGLAATDFAGVVHADGALALQLRPGGGAEFAGLRLPSMQANLVRSSSGAAMLFESPLNLPQLEAATIGTARGLFTSDGQFSLVASSLDDRGLFGWDLRLAKLTASGSWVERQLAASAEGLIRLPYDLATFNVSGALNLGAGTFVLRGPPEGRFFIGTRPFTFTVAPELTRNRLALPGRLTLGAQTDAAVFATQLEIKRNGELNAEFSGRTAWLPAPGNVSAQLSWIGRLHVANGFPQVDFSGEIGLGWPNQPSSIESLAFGLNSTFRTVCWADRIGFRFCTDVLSGATLRSSIDTLSPNTRGALTVPISPAFQGLNQLEFVIP